LDSKQELNNEIVKMEEAELVQLARQGDLGAFNELVLKYQDQIFDHAYGLLGNYDAAEDLTQDAFFLAFRKMYQFRGGSLRVWLLKIVTNLCYDEMRTWKRASLLPLEPINKDGEINESPYWIKDPNLLPEESIEVKELHVGIERGLSTLPINFQIAVTLVDIQELSYQEAAFVMGTSIGTLKSRLARGRLMLRDALKTMDRAKGLSRYQMV
jgi:RNA polymerase sigma-70 factor, ECF subfamily